jgi:hypothetical protein
MEPRRARREAQALLRPRFGRIAVGFLLAALHNAGLATLAHAPSPDGLLKEILGRPDKERPFLLIPAGYPARDTRVPLLETNAVRGGRRVRSTGAMPRPPEVKARR